MAPKVLLAKTKKYSTILFERRLLEFLYAIVVIVLAGIAIYSVYSVFYDYLYENTMTSVVMKTTDNILPFVQYFTVLYYFYPVNENQGRSIIPQSWPLNDSEIQAKNLFPIGPHASKALDRIAERKNKAAFHRNNSTHHLSLDSQCDIATINGMLQELDKRLWMSGESISQINFVYDNDFIGEKAVSVNFSDIEQLIRASFPNFNQSIRPDTNAKLISVIDSFVENPYGDELVEEVLSNLTPFKYLQLEENKFVDLPVTYFNDEFGHNQATVSVLLDFFANKTKRVRTWPIVFGFMPTDYYVNSTNLNTGTEKVQMLFGPLRTPGNVFHTDWPSSATQFIQFDITVKSIGIYNSTDVREKKACEVCGKFTSVNDCMYKCKLNTVVDVCKCIPFIWRRFFRSDSTRKNLPGCTFQHYANCSKSDKFNATPCDPEDFKPCIISRNNYVVNVLYPEEHATNDTPKIIFRFTFDEKTYAVFQDVYQNGIMQTLGQLGGNLGVFLSFSLLGVWQFGVFVYLSWKRRREQQRKKSLIKVDQPIGIISSWLRLAQLTAETQARGAANQSSPDLYQKSNLEEAKQEIDALRQEMENQRQDAKMEREQEMNKFKSLISSLETRLQKQEEERRKEKRRNRLQDYPRKF